LTPVLSIFTPHVTKGERLFVCLCTHNLFFNIINQVDIWQTSVSIPNLPAYSMRSLTIFKPRAQQCVVYSCCINGTDCTRGRCFRWQLECNSILTNFILNTVVVWESRIFSKHTHKASGRRTCESWRITMLLDLVKEPNTLLVAPLILVRVLRKNSHMGHLTWWIPRGTLPRDRTGCVHSSGVLCFLIERAQGCPMAF